MSFDKRYTVISAQTPSGPEYRIYDRINECSIEGGFDTQKWAEAVAEMMEEKWEHERGRICKDRRVSERIDKGPQQGGSRD